MWGPRFRTGACRHFHGHAASRRAFSEGDVHYETSVSYSAAPSSCLAQRALFPHRNRRALDVSRLASSPAAARSSRAGRTARSASRTTPSAHRPPSTRADTSVSNSSSAPVLASSRPSISRTSRSRTSRANHDGLQRQSGPLPRRSGRSVVGYVTAGAGGMTIFKRDEPAAFSQSDTNTFLTENFGGGLKWFSTQGWARAVTTAPSSSTRRTRQTPSSRSTRTGTGTDSREAAPTRSKAGQLTARQATGTDGSRDARTTSRRWESAGLRGPAYLRTRPL